MSILVPEIISIIASFVRYSEDLKNFSLCSRQCRSICTPFLFRSINFGCLNMIMVEKAVSIISNYVDRSTELCNCKQVTSIEDLPQSGIILRKMLGLQHVFGSVKSLHISGAMLGFVDCLAGDASSVAGWNELEGLVQYLQLVRDGKLPGAVTSSGLSLLDQVEDSKTAAELLGAENIESPADILSWSAVDSVASCKMVTRAEGLMLMTVISCLALFPNIKSLHLENILNTSLILAAGKRPLDSLSVDNCFLHIPSTWTGNHNTVMHKFESLLFVNIDVKHSSPGSTLLELLSHLKSCLELTLELRRYPDSLQLPSHWSLPAMTSMSITTRGGATTFTLPTEIDAPKLQTYHGNATLAKQLLPTQFAQLLQIELTGNPTLSEVLWIIKKCASLQILRCNVNAGASDSHENVLTLLLHNLSPTIIDLCVRLQFQCKTILSWSPEHKLDWLCNIKQFPRLEILDVSGCYFGENVYPIVQEHRQARAEEAKVLRKSAFPMLSWYGSSRLN